MKRRKNFNIACCQRYTLLQLVCLINEILGTSIVPVFAEERPGDVKHSLADISRANEIELLQVYYKGGPY